ncbi:MAG: hypothetical protein H7835_10235 [Magnetococcus sp. XQGC-1]
MSGQTLLVMGIQPHSPHFETQLELMQAHLDRGDRVIYVDCDRAISMCDASTSNDPLFCLACVAKRKRGLQLLSPPVQIEPLSSLVPSSEELRLPALTFDSSDSLANFRFDGWDCGEAVVSTFYYIYKTRYPDLTQYTDFVQRGLLSTLRLQRAAREAFRRFQPDMVYFFNGRGVGGRCFVRACQNGKIPFFSHERGAKNDSYFLSKNAIIHDPDAWQLEIQQAWENEPDEARKLQLAEAFFQRHRQGKSGNVDVNYLKNQVKDTLPDGWMQAHPRLVLFTSTETEFSALSGFYDKGIYDNLVDALNRIVADLMACRFSGQLVVRMHPNSALEAKGIMSRFLHHDAPFLRMVLPWDKVDTYALLDSATHVLVVTSTLGMEAAYAGKPVILLGRSRYDRLGSVYTPNTHEEMMQLLQRDLPPLDRSGACRYGYHLMTYGHSFRHVTLKGTNKCAFKARKIRSPWLLDQLLKLKRHRPWLERLLANSIYPLLRLPEQKIQVKPG